MEPSPQPHLLQSQLVMLGHYCGSDLKGVFFVLFFVLFVFWFFVFLLTGSLERRYLLARLVHHPDGHPQD